MYSTFRSPSRATSFLTVLLLLFISRAGLSLDSAVLDDPELMMRLQKKGLDLGALLFEQKKTSTNQTLSMNKGYASIVKVLDKDLSRLQVGDRYLSVTMAKKHRLFDKRWFKSKDAFYELIGVVPRFDMAPFGTSQFPCGETRLIYRLAYAKKWRGNAVYSRLPVTLNVVFWNTPAGSQKPNAPGTCAKLAKEWKNLTPHSAAPFLRTRMTQSNLKSIEINMQAVRWPSTVRPDFGGYAEYILRVFKQQNDGIFEPTALQNTLDVSKIQSSPKLKNQLKSFLFSKQNLENADKGILHIPEKFLALKATSFAFHGSHRLANRQLDQIFQASELDGPVWTKYKSFKTKQAWKRRVDDHSCIGCHQGRSIAGFHFVGIDRPKSFAANKVFFAQSGHLREDRKRREQFFLDLVRGKKPDASRGFSERSPEEKGLYGAHCTTGKDPSFAKWNCAKDYSCQKIVSMVPDSKNKPSLGLGVCLPTKLGTGGDPSEIGSIVQNTNPRRDSVTKKKQRPCSDGYANFDARDGFPSGICYKDCPTSKRRLKKGEACGLIAFNGFNPCLARGEAFTQCLAKYTGELVLKACNEASPCRNDYVCAESKDQSGVCIPPYFLFQLRLDGHPKPS